MSRQPKVAQRALAHGDGRLARQAEGKAAPRVVPAGRRGVFLTAQDIIGLVTTDSFDKFPSPAARWDGVALQQELSKAIEPVTGVRVADRRRSWTTASVQT